MLTWKHGSGIVYGEKNVPAKWTDTNVIQHIAVVCKVLAHAFPQNHCPINAPH